jgi:hypothetical protein
MDLFKGYQASNWTIHTPLAALPPVGVGTAGAVVPAASHGFVGGVVFAVGAALPAGSLVLVLALPGFVNEQFLAFEIALVERRNGVLTFVPVRHLDKGKTARRAALLVTCDGR